MRRLAFRSGLLALAVLGLPGRGSAVLPPDVYIEARASADHHVQVAVQQVRPPETTPGLCRLKARVVTVFRSRDRHLEVGTPVAFALDCLTDGDTPPTGGTLWALVQSIQDARFIEVYLDGEAGALQVARWQYGIIDGPSAAPQCPEGTLNCR